MSINVGIDHHTLRIERRLKDNGVKMPHMFGYAFTLHALARMKVRRIELDWVREALDKPGRSTEEDGVFKHVGEMASVVVNHYRKVVITIGHGTRNDPDEQ